MNSSAKNLATLDENNGVVINLVRVERVLLGRVNDIKVMKGISRVVVGDRNSTLAKPELGIVVDE